MKAYKTIWLAIIFILINACANKEELHYMNPQLSVEDRVNDLISRMTLEEKVAQMNMAQLSKNTGKLTGKEVIQVYINDKISSVTTPVKVLKEFDKVEIKPSEIVNVSFSIPIEEFGLWDEALNYVVEPGEFEIMVGSSSEDIRMRQTIIIE